MSLDAIEQVLEAAIFASPEPLSVSQLKTLFIGEEAPDGNVIREALKRLQEHYRARGVELVEVGSGFRFQAKTEYTPWLDRLYEKKPLRYSRAYLETLALVAYQQPITRGEIEDVRGVAVSSNIIKSLMERDWIKIVGHKDVPGKPALFATTKVFLDYFNLKSLGDLPPLQDVVDLEALEAKLNKNLHLGEQAEMDDAMENELLEDQADEHAELIEEIEIDNFTDESVIDHEPEPIES